jgi:hypothetical protein
MVNTLPDRQTSHIWLDRWISEVGSPHPLFYWAGVFDLVLHRHRLVVPRAQARGEAVLSGGRKP